jgi:hypothetical protein
MNRQCTLSGNRITIAMSNAKRNAPTKIHAVALTIQGGGSCGNISDSVSREPR